LHERIAHAAHIAVLTGAGVSAESGVPTFRDDKNSYWAQFNPQDMASEAGFRAHPQRVWQWYTHRREAVAAVQPNAGHHALAQWALQHPCRMTLVTQNVDGLHQRGGGDAAVRAHHVPVVLRGLALVVANGAGGRERHGLVERMDVCAHGKRV